MFEILLLDLDETILDFKKSEYYSLRKTLRDAGIEPTEEVCSLYDRINQSLWKRLELGEVTRDQVLTGRFVDLYRELGANADPVRSAQEYVDNVASQHYFLPGAEDAVKELAKKHRLFIVSNGATKAQEGRMESADLNRYFEGVFISQTIGVNKPDKAFFDYCFAHIANFDPAKALMVGDSLTSDIKGGKNAGIATCWVNLKHASSGDLHPDYEIEALHQLPALLENM